MNRPVLNYHPTLARELQGFRVWGIFVFRTLELTATPINLTNQVKVGHALDQSRSVQLREPETAHQNNAQSWRSSMTNGFRDSFERIKWLYLLFNYGIKTKTHFEWVLWHWSSLCHNEVCTYCLVYAVFCMTKGRRQNILNTIHLLLFITLLQLRVFHSDEIKKWLYEQWKQINQIKHRISHYDLISR